MTSNDSETGALQPLTFRQRTKTAVPWILASLLIAGIGVLLLIRPEVGGERHRAMNPYLGVALIPMGCIIAGLMFMRHLHNKSTMLSLDPEGFSYTASGDLHRYLWRDVGGFQLVKGPSNRTRLVAFESVSTDEWQDDGEGQRAALRTLPPLADMGDEALCQFMNDYRTAATEKPNDG